jgi:hypothetical protein
MKSLIPCDHCRDKHTIIDKTTAQHLNHIQDSDDMAVKINIAPRAKDSGKF